MKPLSGKEIKIAVVDDHQLFRQGLINLIQQISPVYNIISEAANGSELLRDISTKALPEIVIMDMNMPVMNGYETTLLLKKKYPEIGVLALTMMDDEATLVKMLRAGVNGYLNKDVEPEELQRALDCIAANGYYFNEYVAGKLIRVIQEPTNSSAGIELTEQEVKFIELACSEDTYKVIADKMCLSIKTIDGYRAKLFEKLDVKSRVGLVLYALRHNIVSLKSLSNT